MHELTNLEDQEIFTSHVRCMYVCQKRYKNWKYYKGIYEGKCSLIYNYYKEDSANLYS